MVTWALSRTLFSTGGLFRLFAFLLPFVAVESTVELGFDHIRAGLENNSLIYLDVRTRKELLTDGKVVGSFNIPLPELEEAFLKSDHDFLTTYGFSKPDKNADNVVVACRSGRRAETAIEKLKTMGYNSLKIYKGSFLDWVEKGGPIVKG